MIKVGKSTVTPNSLSSTKQYDGEDVKRQLISDQYGKCYICERLRDTDFEIEHFKSKDSYPELIQEWTNLFLSCRYCNGKKLENYDNILNPLTEKIEDEIKHEVDFYENKACFTPVHATPEHDNTVKLLNSVFNGSGKVRKIKEEKFFEYSISVINRFQSLVNTYLAEKTNESEMAVRNELKIDKEYLGFKYWIVKSNPILASTFAKDIVWKK